MYLVHAMRLHTPSLSDTHYQPTSPKRDHTPGISGKKHASTALIQEASKMHSRNMIVLISRHEVLPPITGRMSCRWPGRGVIF